MCEADAPAAKSLRGTRACLAQRQRSFYVQTVILNEVKDPCISSLLRAYFALLAVRDFSCDLYALSVPLPQPKK